MTTSTVSDQQRRNILFCRDLGPAKNQFAKDATASKPASLVIEGMPIFRSGSFQDSMGEEHLWEPIHLTQMIDHFNMLSSNGIFADVPIRKGHADRGGLFGGESRNRMDELIGYITGATTELRKNPVDGVEYTYFLADLEIIKPEAIEAVSSGLWRNVSAEVGSFLTNNNAEYWPTMMGVAYVDIPAVEGLKGHAKADHNFSLILEEGSMTTPAPQNPNPPVPEVKLQAFSISGTATTDYAAVQAHITKVETENSDLLAFRKEADESARENYVNSLVAENKLLAPQKDGYVAYAKGLDPAAFAAWKGLMDATPALQVTGNQAGGFSHSVSGNQEVDATAQRVNDLKGMISTHSLNQMAPAKIKELGSYKELIALEPSFTL